MARLLKDDPHISDAVKNMEPEPEPNQSHSDSHSYHPDLAGMNYFPSSSGGRYEFDMFGLFPPQYSTLGSFQQHHGTPSGSSSSMSFDSNDFSSMFTTPPPAPQEDVGRRDHPDRERRPPQRYTPRTTPSNHQF
ncbi:hypothetical protein J1N35_009852 [Gossypium stocksii]|uniref:Uncharacterized protein n=1 Tax=Gossypium stocksii TaxID=47602 RepID=A0A9D3VZA0_9ROSI|nr:hypothetical protein J1N35_009852 [Gossypium stocksii]